MLGLNKLFSFFTGKKEVSNFRNREVVNQVDGGRIAPLPAPGAKSKGWWARTFAGESLDEAAWREIHEIQVNILREQRNIVMLEADNAQRAKLRDGMIEHYARIKAADAAMLRIHTALGQGIDLETAMVQLRDLDTAEMPISAIVKTNNPEAVIQEPAFQQQIKTHQSEINQAQSEMSAILKPEAKVKVSPPPVHENATGIDLSSIPVVYPHVGQHVLHAVNVNAQQNGTRHTSPNLARF